MTAELIAFALAIAALVIIVIALVQQDRTPLAAAVLLLAIAQIIVRFA